MAQRFTISSDDSIVIMTHHFERDKELLQFVMRHSLQYLGILGPKHRTERLLESDSWPDWIHSPAGLPIGAQGPDEIAVSIVADIIRTRRTTGLNRVFL